ncbi:GSCOCG00011282001-RA-CDS [Cotesia congregata]|nr:GSCOCG00011282001-RA-CDS [Cotesia congregata]
MKLTDNSGFVRRRKKSKIIRFINYNKDADKENFIRENVISEYVYNENIESILKEATHKANESDNENDISTFTPKNLEVVNDPSQTGDIAIDMKINIDENSTSTCNNKDLCYVSIPRLISEENYINLVCCLNEKQRRFLLHLLHCFKIKSLPLYHCVIGEAVLLIIDEISMIGSKMIQQVDSRLKQIFQTAKPFGGISVIVFEDGLVNGAVGILRGYDFNENGDIFRVWIDF